MSILRKLFRATPIPTTDGAFSPSPLAIKLGTSTTLVDHTRYFRHAPARLRVVANMCGFACGYAAVCRLVPLLLR